LLRLIDTQSVEIVQLKYFKDNYDKFKEDVSASEDKVKTLTQQYHDELAKMQGNYNKLNDKIADLYAQNDAAQRTIRDKQDVEMRGAGGSKTNNSNYQG